MPKVIHKNNDSSKYERINQIYDRLLKTPTGVSISELSKELDVSTKTIQRDLYEVLQEYGAIKEGRQWKIDPKIANDNLGANERIILSILDQMAKSGGKTFYSKAHSLLAQVTQQLEHPIFANINSESLEEANILLFEKLEVSIKQRTQVSFEYDKKRIFIVNPLKLVFFDGFWYLLALDCNEDNRFKKFHLKSIKNLTTTQIHFDIATTLEESLQYANSIWFSLEEPFIVRLLLNKNIRKYFERKPLRGQSVMGQDNDGSLEIEIRITHEMEIIPLILWYLPNIKVLEPQWLAKKVKAKVMQYLDEL